MNLESVSFCVIHAPKIHVENLSSSKYREKEKTISVVESKKKKGRKIYNPSATLDFWSGSQQF